jgi:hypothetical protein
VIREWWIREMDARRVFSAALASVSLLLCVLALAAVPGFVTSGAQDPGGLAKYSAALGGASGIALRAYLLHRRAGVSAGLRSAVVQGGSMALLLFGMFILAIATHPIVGRIEPLGGDAWIGLLATAVLVGLTSSVLWERIERRRRNAVAVLVAVGFIIGGMIGTRIGGAWTVIGGVSILVGILALGRAILQGFQDLRQEMTETAV